METVKLTIELPANLAAALAGFLESMKLVAVEKNITNTPVVGAGVVSSGVNDVIEPPSSVEEVLSYCEENNLVANGRRFYNYYKDKGWRDTNGNLLTNWHERLLMWDEEDRRKNPQLKPVKRQERYDDTDRVARMMGLRNGNSDSGQPDN